MSDVALEVPLAFFAFGGRAEGDDTTYSWIEGFGNALNGASLPCRIAALEESDDAQPFVSDPFLKLDEFDLEAAQFALVVAVFAEVKRRDVY